MNDEKTCKVEIQRCGGAGRIRGTSPSSPGNNLVEVKLFGSKAAGKDQPDSDIDVLVAVEKGGADVEDEVLDIAFDVNLKHDVYVSPRVIDRAILTDPVWTLTPFLKNIAKEGISL